MMEHLFQQHIGFHVQCIHKKIGSLESKGLIKELDSQIQSDKNLYKQWIGRQQSYEAERNDEIDEEYKNSSIWRSWRST